VRALITTTINVPRNLDAWRKAGFDNNDVFIVTGDQKSPHREIRRFLKALPGNNIYFEPDEQTHWKCSEILGWNTIQRRNIALLEAIKRKPDYILTVDDDNYPITRNHAQQLDGYFAGASEVMIASTTDGWYNVGRMMEPPVVHRGYPLSRRHAAPTAFNAYDAVASNVGLVASLWLGAPDIDAVERLVVNPETTAYRSSLNVQLVAGTWCPFNSQSTAYLGALAPLMAVWPFVGRYDDIWASYLARKVMDDLGYAVVYGQPLVRQDRNPHDVLRDMELEMFGYRYTDAFTTVLRKLPNRNDHNVLDTMRATCNDLAYTCSFIPPKVFEFLGLWFEDVRSVL
jgi:reversibly glycosylated polypeptide